MESSASAAELFQACGEGKHTAWDELIQRHGKVLSLVSLRVVRRFGLQHEFDGLLQELWANLYQRRERIFLSFHSTGPGSDLAYLKTVAANAMSDLCRRSVRRQKHEHPLEDMANFSPPAPEHHPDLDVDEAARILERHLTGERAARDIAIFRFHYGFGYTASEISRLPGIDLAESGVETVLFQCRQALKSALGKRETTRTERYGKEKSRG